MKTVVKFAVQVDRIPLIKAIRQINIDYFNGTYRSLAWCRGCVDNCKLNLDDLGVTLRQAMIYLEPWVTQVVQVDADGNEHIFENNNEPVPAPPARTFSLPDSITYADREALANHLIALGNLIMNADFCVYPDA